MKLMKQKDFILKQINSIGKIDKFSKIGLLSTQFMCIIVQLNTMRRFQWGLLKEDQQNHDVK